MKGFYRRHIYLLIFSLLVLLSGCEHTAYRDLDDFRPRGQMIRFSCPDAKLGYAYAMQPRVTSPYYLVIYHERWGLDNYTRQEVERWFDLFDQKINVIAPDLYDGQRPTTAEEAADIMKNLSEIRASHIVKGTYGLYGIKGRYVALGRGFGGYWALQAGILGLGQAAGSIIYYGNPIMDQAKIAFLE
ncbi:MAG: dienelactone hydrolase family protein, partial [Haliscomenobacter sp.]